ncbi:UTP--glucose-1-phosphate uridylyltransferase [Fontisphaera persica]|uniref:UTP--glucose-1-phosphate uridylyltransferase n=1 Tax=Fontisphaera persica TaxID=2974023 RepID=UPI0024C05416|nr:UTP--glucose-1-phosphate uridylyltransferase [Fontisphaera persica]WCJ60293.1 UTP--glucose-1-phosphate uridylyltransferase [Fontisphaera persica]
MDVTQSIADKMRAAGQSEAAIAAFLQAVRRVQAGDDGYWREDEIMPVGELPRYEDLPPSATPVEAWERLAIIKLNGGLGSTMGMQGPKSLLPVKGDDCFLDFIARQVLHCRQGRSSPRFYLMNSFNTRAESLAYLRRYPALQQGQDRLDFLQHQVPKLLESSLAPVQWPEDPRLEWCPPGHGDLYAALQGSSLLQHLLQQGVELLFVSNADNLGAVADARILSWLWRSDYSFVMEVTARTPVDAKGGHLARRRDNGRLLLREASQCAAEDRAWFEDTERHRFFNTNNLWIRLPALARLLEQHHGALPLPLIKNRKNVDPQRPDSPQVLQLESAMGAAIELFDSAAALVVPRTRFAPVKTTDDLLAVRSDAYAVTTDFRLVLEEARNGLPPQIKLDAWYYRWVEDFNRAFVEGVPSLRECQSLEVMGPCLFSSGVLCKGRVKFENASSTPKRVPPAVYCDTTVRL